MIRKPAPPRRMGLQTLREPAAARARRAPFPQAVGDRIDGDLMVIGHLAAGRIGHLYQVWSTRDWCAYTCKILAEERRNRRADVAALRREGHILRRARHPTLVRSFGRGEHEGLPYLLVEYLEGPSLFDVLEQSPSRQLPLADALRAAIHLGSALNHLHRCGFLHLDLKPANMILRDGVPILIDFDTARPLRPGVRPHRRLGTPPYMAPEHVARATLTPATDVYGLGALLYELITGRWPFEDAYQAEDRAEGDVGQFPQLGGTMPPAPRTFRPEITASLEATIMTCLRPAPEERFPAMHQLLLALIAELDGPESVWPAGMRVERRREPRD
ncbi:MAG TPA: serine/threonine-protein kinase [Longimicrobiales bacterium]|nr:serine/threonine-protein kinase [Longimicrobiales bacterium]